MKFHGWRILKTVTYVTFKLEGVSDITDFNSLRSAKEFVLMKEKEESK